MEGRLGDSTTVLEVIPESPDCTVIVTAPQRPEDKGYTLGPLLPSMREDGFQFSETASSSENLSLIYPTGIREEWQNTGHVKAALFWW